MTNFRQTTTTVLFLLAPVLFVLIVGRVGLAQAPRTDGQVRLSETAAKELMRKAVPKNSELPTGITWGEPTYRDGSSSVRASWKGKKRIHCRYRDRDDDYQLSCDIRYQTTPVTLAEFQASYLSHGYKVCDGFPRGVIKGNPVLRVCHHLYFWKGPHFNGLISDLLT